MLLYKTEVRDNYELVGNTVYYFRNVLQSAFDYTAYADDEICMNLKLWIIFVREMCKMSVQTAYTYIYE